MKRRPIVVLTALDLEYRAVNEQLVDARVHIHGQGTRFRRGRLAGGNCEIALALVGKGNHAAAVLAERAMAEFNPCAVFFIGVAGALKSGIELGDVVVATHVYAYHGGASEDDGFKSRPRVWEASHAVDQLAREVDRSGVWRKQLSSRGHRPGLHFGPIAAGEVVLKSVRSDQASWVRNQYNDALAIEMEGAGVAQAGHLNGSLPVVVVRGISDRADANKQAGADATWQPRAVRNATAFALTLADAFTASFQTTTSNVRESDMGSSFRNVANDNARVGIQAGIVHGGIRFHSNHGPGLDLVAEVAELRRQLERAHASGRLDDVTFEAATAELDVVDKSLAEGPQSGPGVLMVAMKRLRGLIGDLSDLAAKVTVILTLVKGLS